MKQSIQLRLGQHLTMTPQLQQAIRLLQLSTIELQLEIQSALDSNLMLEMLEDGSDDITEAESLAVTPPGETSTMETPAERSEAASEGAEAGLPEELPVDSDWDDIYDGATSYTSGADNNRDYLEPAGPSTESLQEHLIWQMRLTPFSETDLAIAIAIIDSINEDGYLEASVEEIHQGLAGEFEIEPAEVEAVLHRIQRFDPPGVGARNLGECLLAQLRQRDPATPWLAEAMRLVSEHLDLLAAHDYTHLMRQMKIGEIQLQQVIALVQSLNPRPGNQISNTSAQYVVPDVFVKKQNGAWKVELNPETAPRIRINPQYAGMVRRADNSEDNNYLKSHLQEARWFIKSLHSRNETLLKVATCIVEHQRGFLEYGEQSMKPLVLRDVAESVEMHESTISRITTQKYLHTPRGIYEFKYFFSSHVSTTDGGECSATAIRAMIKKLIAEEKPAKPLSDSKLAEMLLEQGINVARRTVAKYREAMCIPPSNERKRLA